MYHDRHSKIAVDSWKTKKVVPPGGTSINIDMSQTHQLPEEVSRHLHVPMSPGLQDVVDLTIPPPFHPRLIRKLHVDLCSTSIMHTQQGYIHVPPNYSHYSLYNKHIDCGILYSKGFIKKNTCSMLYNK